MLAFAVAIEAVMLEDSMTSHENYAVPLKPMLTWKNSTLVVFVIVCVDHHPWVAPAGTDPLLQ